MKKRKKPSYKNESIGKVEVIPDFLPSPENLVMKEDSVKITLQLSKASVEFFKELAEKKHIPYQKMIRALIDKYVSRYQ